MNYEKMVKKAFDGLNIEPSDKMIEDILFRIKIMNKMIVVINNKNKFKKLCSKQMLAKIIFDYLHEQERRFFIA